MRDMKANVDEHTQCVKRNQEYRYRGTRGVCSTGNSTRTNYQTSSFVVSLRDYLVQFWFGSLMV